jgi:hypothetical protein
VTCVGWGINKSDRFINEIQRSLDLTMPQTPADPLDGLGEASSSMAICLRRVGPALGGPLATEPKMLFSQAKKLSQLAGSAQPLLPTRAGHPRRAT